MPVELIKSDVIETLAVIEGLDPDLIEKVDWRTVNKHPRGVTQQSSIYTPLLFEKGKIKITRPYMPYNQNHQKKIYNQQR
jgi:hypothetical protein